eukprot:scaffold20209_cov182-Amphora_coffeaeformis.AAC.5
MTALSTIWLWDESEVHSQTVTDSFSLLPSLPELHSEEWASLSSDYPPPRKPKGPPTLDENLKALMNWRDLTVNNFKQFCQTGKEELKKECESRNKQAADKIAKEAPDGLTRNAEGYNFKDFVLVIDNKLLTVDQVSKGSEKLYQLLHLHSATNYMGIAFQQHPEDAMAIGDLLWRVQPDLLIEFGTSGGGSAFYYSHIMQRYNPKAKILTMDPAAGNLQGTPLKQWNDANVLKHCPFCEHSTTTQEWNHQHGSIRFFRGLPDSPQALQIAREAAAKAKTVLVMEDSNHLYDAVTHNINAYHDLVTPGSYLIVQDTRLGGPHKAVKDFLKTSNGACFDIDKTWEYMVFSQHFDGYLRKRTNCKKSSA